MSTAIAASPGILDRARIVAGPGFSRWLVPPAALCVHLSIGQAYAFSVFNLPMTKLIGISKSAPGDWQLTDLGWIFSIAILFLGLASFATGSWLDRVGPPPHGRQLAHQSGPLSRPGVGFHHEVAPQHHQPDLLTAIETVVDKGGGHLQADLKLMGGERPDLIHHHGERRDGERFELLDHERPRSGRGLPMDAIQAVARLIVADGAEFARLVGLQERKP